MTGRHRYNSSQPRVTGARRRLRMACCVALAIFGTGSAFGAEYTVQIGTFDRAPASGFTENATANGELVTSPGPNGWTRYSIGRFDSSADARDTLVALQSAGYYDAFIMRLDGASPIATAARGEAATDDGATQAGRFRIRTFDTSSGETRDFEPSSGADRAAGSTPAAVPISQPVEPTELPAYLREKLVYLDGIPHIKDGDSFVPLTDAIDE
ncbi:MAG: SPOR domain-containing protein [Pseudomonadota bacterium]